MEWEGDAGAFGSLFQVPINSIVVNGPPRSVAKISRYLLAKLPVAP